MRRLWQWSWRCDSALGGTGRGWKSFGLYPHHWSSPRHHSIITLQKSDSLSLFPSWLPSQSPALGNFLRLATPYSYCQIFTFFNLWRAFVDKKRSKIIFAGDLKIIAEKSRLDRLDGKRRRKGTTDSTNSIECSSGSSFFFDKSM